MSGDVQPRKRKDKKRKKDDLGVDEPRGTAAALGDGDVFMHSYHDHGTGGHWCAKVIFFSLLFVLVGLIGLIILENRGLSELEANAVQSQYSGVLEGWLEDAPEDDHHDEHTLELNHHDDEHDEEGHSDEAGHDEHEDHDDDEEHQEDEDDEEDTEEDDDEQDANGSQEQDLEDDDEQEEDIPYRKYYDVSEATPGDDEDDQDEQDNDDSKIDDDDDEEDDNVAKNDDDDDEEEDDDVSKNDDDDDEEDDDVSKNDDDDDEEDDDVTKNDDEQDEQLSHDVDQDDENDDDDDNYQSMQQDEDEDENANGDSNEQNYEDEDEHEEDEEDTSLELEKIEKEAPADEEPISNELPALPEPDDDDDSKDQESVEDEAPDADDGDDADDADDDAAEPDDDFLEADDDEPPVERITAPAGKPFVEVEEPSTEKPTDSLAEEDEYEKRQEQLRREEEEASSKMWLKLSIGGALLVATHAIIRRATASSDVPRSEEGTSREATPIDRRMTLIPEEPSEPVPIKKVSQESYRPAIQEITKHIPSITRKSPTFEESEEEVEEEEEEPVFSKIVRTAQAAKQEEKKELYSDDEEAEEEDIEEEPVVLKKAAPAAARAPAAAKPPAKEPTPEPDEDVPDDVEIIDEEQIEEDEEAEDEEEISDVDDEELLTRLEAKYGRLPEPERPARRKDGGNSLQAGWPGEPADAYWRQQLDEAEREYNQGAVTAAADRASAAQLKTSGRARWLVARALDAAAEKKRDNTLLGRAIAAYLELLKMNERLSDKKLLEIAERAINRIQFRGTYLNAEPIYRLLIRRFPDEPSHRTNLTVMFLMANRGDLAEEALKETLKRWPNDRLALAQYGFILKTQHNRLEEALDLLQRALQGDTGPAMEPRFYYHLGDTLLLLGRFDEAHEVHKRGAAHGHFLSPAQRSLYNVPKLEGRPWWRIEDTPYVKLAHDLETNWKEILREGEAAKALYEQEKEGLKERGEWSQLDLFVRGREIDGRCARAPVTCAVVRREIAAAGCRRGQVKFSSMRAGTHVRPHVGPTNCRLRMHLGLSNTKDTFIRVHKETRQWETGKVFVFDDSFEHEVWHNGTGSRLVLIVDVWHPGLGAAERSRLPAI